MHDLKCDVITYCAWCW